MKPSTELLQRDVAKITKDVKITETHKGVRDMWCVPCDQHILIGRSNRFANLRRHLTTTSHIDSVNRQVEGDSQLAKFRQLEDEFSGIFIRKDDVVQCRDCGAQLKLQGKHILTNARIHIQSMAHKQRQRGASESKAITSFFAKKQPTRAAQDDKPSPLM